MDKFARFAENVWGISAEGKSREALADAGLQAMEAWMKEIGVVMKLRDLGADENMIPDLVNGTLILDGGYKKLDKEEIAEIFREAM